MSTIQVAPPQTYSRLFRPWDVKSAKDSKSLEQFINLSNSVKCLSNDLRTTEIKVHQQFYDHSLLAEYLPVEQFPTIGSFPSDNPYGALLGLPPSSPELYYPSGPLSLPVLGMEATEMKAVEQEYLRVLAEDAQIKAANARKQRPKKFKCSHCNVAFSNNGQLKGHVRIHTGERPFKCDLSTCGKTFTRNEELTRHKRIHTGLRPFGCSACGKKFGRRDHLKKHMKTHMPPERHLSSAIFIPMYPYLYGY